LGGNSNLIPSIASECQNRQKHIGYPLKSLSNTARSESSAKHGNYRIDVSEPSRHTSRTDQHNDKRGSGPGQCCHRGKPDKNPIPRCTFAHRRANRSGPELAVPGQALKRASPCRNEGTCLSDSSILDIFLVVPI
jgi:hypothetical protein